MTNFDSLKGILSKFDPKADRYISREFQKYGYDLAEELGDLEHKSLYMRLAKITPRHLLEQARYFVKDAGNVKSPSRLFMWKLKQLREEWKGKNGNTTNSTNGK